MTIYPVNVASDLQVNKNNKVNKPVDNNSDLQSQPAKKANFLTNQLAALAMLGASLIGAGSLTSCTYDDSSYDEIDIPTKVTDIRQNPVKQSLVSNIENMCNNLNIETGINTYGDNATCNKITHPDGSYEEVYSQRNTSKMTPDTIYTNGFIIHRNIPQNSPYYELNNTGVKYFQRITQDKEGNINIVRKYNDNNYINNIKKGDIETITISAQDDGSYIYTATSPNSEITTKKMYNKGGKTYLGSSVIESFSSYTDGKMPVPLTFNPNTENWENIEY